MNKKISNHDFVVWAFKRYRRRLLGMSLSTPWGFKHQPQNIAAWWLITNAITVAKLVDPLTLRSYILYNHHQVKEPLQLVWVDLHSILKKVYDFKEISLTQAVKEGRIKLRKEGII